MLWRWVLQQALGGLRRIPQADLRVVPSSNGSLGITKQCVQDLSSGKAPVLVCRGALPADACAEVARRLEAVVAAAPITNGQGQATAFAKWYLGADLEGPATDYDKMGYTKTDVFREEGYRMAAGRAASRRYLARANETRRFLEEVFNTTGSPIGRVAKELSSLPGITCSLETCPKSGEAFLPCVVRRMLPGARKAEGNLHMDTVIPGRTFSINVYLTTPEQGGELILYPIVKDAVSRTLNSHFFSTLEIQNFFPDKSFYTGSFLDKCGIEPIVYQPEPGDVVFIDPAYPHAVRDFGTDEARLSLQTFLQSRWEGKEHILEYAV